MSCGSDQIDLEYEAVQTIEEDDSCALSQCTDEHEEDAERNISATVPALVVPTIHLLKGNGERWITSNIKEGTQVEAPQSEVSGNWILERSFSDATAEPVWSFRPESSSLYVTHQGSGNLTMEQKGEKRCENDQCASCFFTHS